MMTGTFKNNELVGLFVRLTLVSAVTFLSMKWIMSQLDPTNNGKKKARKRAEEQLRRLTNNSKTSTASLTAEKFTDYELMIAAHLVHPEDITVSWTDIAGLEGTIETLWEHVILPLQRQDLFRGSTLSKPPGGVLLYGPPGCGKTLIAKAMAKEANTRFINLDVSILTDKWYGESQKLTAAVFSLAAKLQPCIIFIDEIDSFLRLRSSTDHEATAMMKAQFMCFWDGLTTDRDSTVIIMGATNRLNDLDPAIRRRMALQLEIPAPRAEQRELILDLILKNEPVSEEVDISNIARDTRNFSGSDLRELCRNASVYRIRDYLKASSTSDCVRSTIPVSSAESEDEYHDALRPITMDDFNHSLSNMLKSKRHCELPSMINRLDLD